MNEQFSERGSRRHSIPIEAELDALVAREVAALARRPQAPKRRDSVAPRPPARRGDVESDAPSEMPPPRGPMSSEEEAFIANAAAFLRSRPDPDVLLEDIWARVLDGAPRPAHEDAVAEIQTPTGNEEASEATPASGPRP